MQPPKPAPTDLKPVTLPDGRVVRLTQADLDSIWHRISVDESGCWIWSGSSLPTGYGRVRLAGAYVYTHRLAYMIFAGEIAKGLHTDHLCRNPPCCNPEHLEPVTPRENVLRSPIAPAAINANKTHCKRGHELVGLNLGTMASGGRWCRTCAKQRFAGAPFDETPVDLKPQRPLIPRRSWTADACAKGHPLDLRNTYVDPKGYRHCRACRAAAQNRYERRQKGKS